MGFTLDIDHLDGHKVPITREKVTWPGARIRKNGEGMPNYENNNLRGTLYITFDVEFPKTQLGDTEKEGLLKIDLTNQTYDNDSFFYRHQKSAQPGVRQSGVQWATIHVSARGRVDPPRRTWSSPNKKTLGTLFFEILA